MMRLYVLAGFACLFLMMNMNGNLNKYINTKYAYLSQSAIVLLAILFVFEFIRLYAKEREAGKRKAKLAADAENGAGGHDHAHLGVKHAHDHHDHAHDHHDPEHDHHSHSHDHHDHSHDHHGHSHDHHGHSHDQPIRWKRYLGYGILVFPLLTGFFLPVQTLDSSFVKAKGFSFPDFNVSADNPGFHQFLKPDTSVFYGKQGYAKVSKKELNEFLTMKDVQLTDVNFLKGLESLYNFPDAFIGREVSFDGFIYKGDQVEGNQYFVFRFGFIHCVADSGVFGMLVDFPKGSTFQNDQWVHVTGKLSSEFYQPFKQTLPVLEVKAWNDISKPEDPYVYRA
ncbi:TIGR03943 family protein [Paenibacillus rhizovicinus]|uniref:TIGR03943 family protein n=1 Tax=Paenibacillus rhizovicinus TaxID=2704463 RepID=A0A6C0P8E2_9BACL|nr:TIGR03943 family protein [Paenibacillus rhizovicinus]QHW34645.1 TIGR03943 family protein [Paenibacillus rhizovicinus]